MEAIYPIPNVLASWEEAQRWQHRDLSDLDIKALERELYRARHRSMMEDPTPHLWLAERIEAVAAEINLRRYPQGPPPAPVTGPAQPAPPSSKAGSRLHHRPSGVR